MITAFRGRWTRLSNYSLCSIMYKGHFYTSVEHAYQAMKSLDPDVQRRIREQPSPAAAKRLARAVELRADWDNVKISIMRELLLEKFSQEPDKSLLMSTTGEGLVEGNWWGDIFWGQCPLGTGENWLGKLLMQLRAEFADHIPPTPSSETDWFGH
jgi:ribA/ribD-fused uncharacterized protein